MSHPPTGESRSPSPGRVLPALFVLMLAAALRCPHLAADAPIQWLRRRPGETTSGAFLSDEGWYNRNARRVAQGRSPAFRPGAIDTGRVTPAYFVLQAATMKVSGVDLVNARASSAIAGVLAVLLLLLLLGTGPMGLAAAAVVACDFVLVAYSRLALPDSLGVLCVVAAGLAACRDRPATAGVLSVLAYAVKPPYLLPAFAGALAAVPRGHRVRFLLGAGAAALAFGLLVVAPYHAELQALAERLSPKRGLRYGDPFGFLHELVWWHHWGPLLPLALVGAGGLLRAEGMSDPRFRWAAGSLAGALLAVVPFGYQPLRYHLSYVVPAATLAASCLLQGRRTRWLALLGLAGLLAFDAGRLATSPTSYTLRDAARQAGHKAGPDAVVLGHVADTFALEAGWQAVIPAVEAEPDARPRARALRPTHLLTLRSGEARRWSRDLLDRAAPESPSGDWTVMGDYYSGHRVELWELGQSTTSAATDGALR